MKLMIDIPYGHYCTIKDGFLSECLQATTEAILNGTPIPDNATNGDMIKALFPNAKISLLKSETEKAKVAVEWGFEPLPSYYNLFYEDWWNAPYKRGETE